MNVLPAPHICSTSCWERNNMPLPRKGNITKSQGQRCQSLKFASLLTTANAAMCSVLCRGEAAGGAPIGSPPEDRQVEWTQLWCLPRHLAHLVGQSLVQDRIGGEDFDGHALHAPVLQRCNKVGHLGVDQLQPANKVSEGGLVDGPCVASLQMLHNLPALAGKGIWQQSGGTQHWAASSPDVCSAQRRQGCLVHS